MKYKMGYLAALMSVVLPFGTAMAADVHYDKATAAIELSGVIDDYADEKGINAFGFQIFYPGKQPSDVQKGDMGSVILTTGQVNADENGAYTKNVTLADNLDEGSYLLQMQESRKAATTTAIYYVQPLIYNGIKDTFNGITTKTDMQSFLETEQNRKRLDLDFSVLTTLQTADPSGAYLDRVYTAMLDKVPVANTKDITNYYYAEVALSGLELLNDSTILTEQDYLLLNGRTTYQTFTESQNQYARAETVGKLVGKHFDGLEDFYTAFDEAVILSYCNKAINSNEVTDLLEVNKTYLTGKGFNMSKYDGITDGNVKRGVVDAICAKGFATFGALKAAFEAALPTDTASGSHVGGNGGNGGAGRREEGTTVILPPATPIQPYDKTEIFSDLSGNEWAREAIEELYKKGILNGKQANLFCPDDLVLREELVKMVVAALNIPMTEAELPFTDAVSDAWYNDYLSAAYANEVIKGVSADAFGVGTAVTREDLAVILFRAAQKFGNYQPNATALNFTDASEISEYAQDAVAAFAGDGIISGMGDGSFQPKATATRAQAAQMIYKLMKMLEVK